MTFEVLPTARSQFQGMLVECQISAGPLFSEESKFQASRVVGLTVPESLCAWTALP